VTKRSTRKKKTARFEFDPEGEKGVHWSKIEGSSFIGESPKGATPSVGIKQIDDKKEQAAGKSKKKIVERGRKKKVINKGSDQGGGKSATIGRIPTESRDQVAVGRGEWGKSHMVHDAFAGLELGTREHKKTQSGGQEAWGKLPSAVRA